MAKTIQCDLAIVGGGLAGGLIALALAHRRPEIDVLLVEAEATIGGNHIWSFFGSDVAGGDRWLIEPLVCHGWRGYHIAFPMRRRQLDATYYTILSERLDAAVRAALPADRLLTGARASSLSPTAALLEDGTRIEAKAVIDARGPGDLGLLDLGWQKFVGQVVRTATPHGMEQPIVMDATVEQIDGYRFVYVLPLAPDRLLLEDTYYSDTPDLDRAALAARIADYAAAKGWVVTEIEREESGVLPVALGGDFDGYWQSGGKAAKAGVRAALFHPTTGYSLPDAIRTALFVAGLADPASSALHDRLRDFAKAAWASRGFYRLLDRMLFRAAEPAGRYKVLERFYGLDAALIGRFYAARSTLADKVRVLSGRPPVPFFRALGVVRETRS